MNILSRVFLVLVVLFMVGCRDEEVDEKTRAVQEEMRESSKRESVLEDFKPTLVVPNPGIKNTDETTKTED